MHLILQKRKPQLRIHKNNKMNTISEIWSLMDSFLLRGIFVSVFIILVAKFFFKNRIDIKVSLNIIRIILIFHSAAYIILVITSLLFNNSDNTFLTRAFGLHWWAYWIMMILNSLLPLTLLSKRLSNRNIYILLVTILMNIGLIFESFVIHMTHMEGEYMDETFNPYLPTSTEVSVVLKGLILGIIILLAGNLIKMKRIRN